MDSSNDSLSVIPALSGSSSVLLTPGRTRNIAQDMEALRLSRQDNPYLQQVMASRESLIESHHNECEDDAILMSQEFGSAVLDFVDEDPVTLKEIHEHMIRSPPPTSCWPHETLSQRAASAFDFEADTVLYTNHHDSQTDKDYFMGGRSPRRIMKGFELGGGRARSSRSASPRSHDLSICGRPLSLPGESHLRNALGRKQNNQPGERFSLLQHPKPRRRHEDSIRLVSEFDK